MKKLEASHAIPLRVCPKCKTPHTVAPSGSRIGEESKDEHAGIYFECNCGDTIFIKGWSENTVAA